MVEVVVKLVGVQAVADALLGRGVGRAGLLRVLGELCMSIT